MKLPYRVEIKKRGIWCGCTLFYFPSRKEQHEPFSLYSWNGGLSQIKRMNNTKNLLNLLDTLGLEFSFEES